MKIAERSATLACPICASDSPFEASFSDVYLYRCPVCDHCFTDPRGISTPESYGPEYFQKNWFHNPNLTLFEELRKAIVRHSPDASVLDVGCGNGDFLKFLRAREPRLVLTGIDLSPNLPVEGIQFIQGSALTHSISQCFDVVVNLAAIEHISDVRQFANRLVAFCKTGGLVVTTTVNERGLLYETARLLNRVGYRGPFEQLYSKHHLNHFNIRSLQRLFEIAGLSTVGLIRHDIPMAAVDFDASRAVPRSLSRNLLWIGVWGIFLLGRISGRTYLQTLLSRKR